MSQYRSPAGGFLNLIYILIAISIFVLKLAYILQGKNVHFNEQIVKQNDIELLNITSGNFQISIRAYQNSISNKMSSSFSFQHHQKGNVELGRNLRVSQYSRYGIQVRLYVRSVSIDSMNRSIEKFQVYPLQQCEKDLYAACIPSGLSIYVKGRIDFNNYREIKDKQIFRQSAFMISKCNQTEDDKCQNISTDLKFFINYNNAIFANATSHNSSVQKQIFSRSFQSHNFLNERITLWEQVMLKRVIMQTDNSILPHFILAPQYQQSSFWFYDQQKDEQLFEYRKPIDDLLVFSFKRSAYTHIFVRSFDKIDDILGQVFGTISLFGLLLFGVLSGYNQWCFEQFIRKKLGLSYHEPNIFKFYRDKVISFFGCLCSTKYRNYIQEQAKNKQYLQQRLDLLNLIASQNEPHQCMNISEDNKDTKQNNPKQKQVQELNKSINIEGQQLGNEETNQRRDWVEDQCSIGSICQDKIGGLEQCLLKKK